MVNRITAILWIVLFVNLLGAATLSGEEIESCYYSSYELEKQNRYLDAMKALTPVLEAFPETYTVNYRLGWLAYLNGSFSDAYTYYGKALAIYPSSIEVLHGVLLIEVARKEWKKVEAQARKIIAIDYYNQDANWWLSVALRTQNHPEEAKKVMIQMLSLFPTSTSYLNEYGKSLFETGETAAAEEVFANILILEPYHQEAVEYLKKLKK